MSAHTLVPVPDQLHLVSLSAVADGITLVAQTRAETACCPLCGHRSARIHSRYQRTLADLPWQGIPAHVLLWSRRFFCDTPACPRRIFTERLPGVAAPHARRTDRLRDWFTHVAFALGGEAGARLLCTLGVTVSGDALLAHIRAFPLSPRHTPRILSVDDFALRRGRTYGSILVRVPFGWYGTTPCGRSVARSEREHVRGVAHRPPRRRNYQPRPERGVR